jgi:N-acyl-L-homoserine lactone synthetase
MEQKVISEEPIITKSDKMPSMSQAASSGLAARTSDSSPSEKEDHRATRQRTRLLLPTQGEDLKACFALRFRYFVQQRGWIPPEKCPDGEETDRYDPHALHLAVFGGDKIKAYLRVLPFDPDVGFMLDHELSAILSPQEREALPRENAVELSRLVCCPGDGCDGGQDTRSIKLLFRQLYHVALERGFTRFYIVVEAKWLGPFARRFGLPFQVVGQSYLFPDGTRTVAATATVEELEAGLRRRGEDTFRWYCAQDEDEGMKGAAP